MKVLIIHTRYQYSGGEDTVVTEEIKLLKSQGINFKLLAFNNTENSLLKLIQVPFNLHSYFKTKNILATFKPDIVHIHNLHFAGSASVIYAIKKLKVPFVTTIHNFRLLCPSGTLFHKGKLFLYSLNKPFSSKAVLQGVYKNSRIITFWISLSMYLHNKLGTWKYCNQYIVLSDHAKDIFLHSKIGLTANQITVKPNFTSLPAIKHIKPQDYFLYVGRLTEEKGIQLLLDAFSNCSYKIKIAGDGPLKNEVIDASNKYKNIEYLGSVNKSEVIDLLQHCSALIFPSIWFEGMPLTIIEAFACSTAVIASNIGAMQSMIIADFNGLHFEPNNKEDLLNCIHKWVDLNEKEKQEYRLNAFETYQDLYTPEKNVKQLLNIYNQVINKECVVSNL